MVHFLAAAPSRVSPRLHEVVSQRAVFASDPSASRHRTRLFVDAWDKVYINHDEFGAPSRLLLLCRAEDYNLHVRTSPPRNLVFPVACSRFGSGNMDSHTLQPRVGTACSSYTIRFRLACPGSRNCTQRGLANLLDRQCGFPVCLQSSLLMRMLDQILGWAGYVKVDGTAYNWLGDPNVSGASKATQKSLTVSTWPDDVTYTKL